MGIVGNAVGGIFAIAIIIIGASLLLPLYKDTTAAVTQAQTAEAEKNAAADKATKGERICDLRLEFQGELDLKRSDVFNTLLGTNFIVYINEKDPLLLNPLRIGFSDRISSGGTSPSTTSGSSSSSSSSTTKTTTSGSSTSSSDGFTVKRDTIKNFKYTWLAGSCYNKGASTPASFIQGLSFIDKIQNQDADKFQNLSEEEIQILNDIQGDELATLSFEDKLRLKEFPSLYLSNLSGLSYGDSFSVQISELNKDEKALSDSLGNIVWEKRIEIADGHQIVLPYKWQVFFVLNDVKAQDYIIEFVAKEKSINEQPANEPVFYKVLTP